MLEVIFSCLSVKELIKVARTCKRFCRVAGGVYRRRATPPDLKIKVWQFLGHGLNCDGWRVLQYIVRAFRPENLILKYMGCRDPENYGNPFRLGRRDCLYATRLKIMDCFNLVFNPHVYAGDFVIQPPYPHELYFVRCELVDDLGDAYEVRELRFAGIDHVVLHDCWLNVGIRTYLRRWGFVIERNIESRNMGTRGHRHDYYEARTLCYSIGDAIYCRSAECSPDQCVLWYN